MYRILVAVDGSERAERAAQFAIDLAKRIEDAEVRLVNVQEPVEESQTHGLGREAIGKHRETLAVQAGAAAREIAEQAGVRCTFVWHFGDPAHVLVEEARDAQCDLLVMGTHGEGAIQNLLLGAVTSRALHLASVPITLVR